MNDVIVIKKSDNHYFANQLTGFYMMGTLLTNGIMRANFSEQLFLPAPTIISRGLVRSLRNIYDGTFCENCSQFHHRCLIASKVRLWFTYILFPCEHFSFSLRQYFQQHIHKSPRLIYPLMR